MKTLLLLLTLAGLAAPALAQPQAYQFFDAEGRRAKFKKLLKAAAEADVVFFGELHDDPVAHWLQLELARELDKSRNLRFGAEMFERHQQRALNAYLEGRIDAKELADTTDLWQNFKTDYKPLVDYARAQGIAFDATNIPRKYARRVFYEGLAALDTLPPEEKALMTPTPFPVDFSLPSYKAMTEMLRGPGHGHDGERDTTKERNFVRAQAIKDATMAHVIAENLSKDVLYYHLNGAYHSDNKEGIVWYLNRKRPGLNILTITTVRQSGLRNLNKEHEGKADFILVTPETMPRSY